jgi:hypothetical protein
LALTVLFFVESSSVNRLVGRIPFVTVDYRKVEPVPNRMSFPSEGISRTEPAGCRVNPHPLTDEIVGSARNLPSMDYAAIDVETGPPQSTQSAAKKKQQRKPATRLSKNTAGAKS